MRRTEGWAAGLCLAAISMDTYPDPDQSMKELIAEDRPRLATWWRRFSTASRLRSRNSCSA